MDHELLLVQSLSCNISVVSTAIPSAGRARDAYEHERGMDREPDRGVTADWAAGQ